ncbi:isopentenyl-diphosphate Delta-isomerase [Georgenia sp. SYP-B2076]|uniref:isopentenyl-diphosphate Delta-isomerase n=1 Tax=Georgenia sp. SYP-B2076 TaxID=2495881 RepID=UPI000F8F2EEC|nr:isopentenyl-diphosphate Delta-isomerase [Georgenia sp. SYP-B2076]
MHTSRRRPPDHVVLVDERGTPVGAAPRSAVHGPDAPLHLAFSCYLFRGDGKVLLARRALARPTWPGVWTNALGGHPRAGEPVPAAIARRARRELGVGVTDLVCALPHFRYRATDPSGRVENVLCPVYLAWTTAEPHPHPREVMEMRWVEPEELGRAVAAAPWALSPWLVTQVGELAEVDPAGLAAGVTELAG